MAGAGLWTEAPAGPPGGGAAGARATGQPVTRPAAGQLEELDVDGALDEPEPLDDEPEPDELPDEEVELLEELSLELELLEPEPEPLEDELELLDPPDEPPLLPSLRESVR